MLARSIGVCLWASLCFVPLDMRNSPFFFHCGENPNTLQCDGIFTAMRPGFLLGKGVSFVRKGLEFCPERIGVSFEGD